MACSVPASASDYSRPEPYWAYNRSQQSHKPTQTRLYLMSQTDLLLVPSVSNRCAGYSAYDHNEDHLEKTLEFIIENRYIRRVIKQHPLLEVCLQVTKIIFFVVQRGAMPSLPV